jgi:predicted TIM-barrel fold metal-dependent hydrolase
MSWPTSSRRQFLATSAACGTAVLASARSVRGNAPSSEPRFKYIDIHTHVGTFYWGHELTADELVRMMDEHDVERAVVLPLVSPEAAPYPQTTLDAIAAHRAHPDRLIPFCALDPRCATLPPTRQAHVPRLEGMVEILTRYKEAGCRGFGEHKVGLPFDHPLMMMLYEACAKVELPILFHLDDIRSWDEPGLPALEHALREFPELPFIGHAAGFWASISGDATIEDFGRYPEVPRPVAAGGALDRLMEAYPNLYGDLSEPGGERAIARDLEFGREFIVRRADQLLFGTDWLMAGQTVPQFELLASLDLPEDVQRKVYRENALRLLKLEDIAG